ncbi:MAG: hypothetical protein LBC85_07940 [Fibromonadaceae bacterium]|nr:hypothetical protein [Fibromonadaceae bacterium]
MLNKFLTVIFIFISIFFAFAIKDNIITRKVTTTEDIIRKAPTTEDIIRKALATEDSTIVRGALVEMGDSILARNLALIFSGRSACLNEEFIYYPLICADHFTERIYDKYLVFYKCLGGKIEIELTVLPDGSVVNDTITFSSTGARTGKYANDTVPASKMGYYEFDKEIIDMFYNYKWEIVGGTYGNRQKINDDGTITIFYRRRFARCGI